MIKGGTMSKKSSTKILTTIITLLSIIAIVKISWVAIEYIYLPEGAALAKTGTAKRSLYYRYKFASDATLPNIKKPTKKPVKKATSISHLKLVGIYSGKGTSIVTVLRGTKSYIIAAGESVDGFVLVGTTEHTANFQKNGKEYILQLFEGKGKKTSHIISTPSAKAPEQIKKKDAEKRDPDAPRQVSRNLIEEYSTDMDKIMRDIGLSPIKNGKRGLKGYKVRFVRKGSPFADIIGLKRGDVIKAINGEDIVDLAGPMNMLKSADSIESLTLTIVRGTEEKELEYEVK
jgi:type II secretion system protein C